MHYSADHLSHCAARVVEGGEERGEDGGAVLHLVSLREAGAGGEGRAGQAKGDDGKARGSEVRRESRGETRGREGRGGKSRERSGG